MTITTLTMDSNDYPSFNTHSSNNSVTATATANRVIHELLLTENHYNNNFSFLNNETPTSNSNTQNEDQDQEEKEFEFPIDEKISPRFPLFDRTLLLDIDHNPKPEIEPSPVRFSLGKLLIEARDQSGSCSSSDADELDGITPETYCVWKPNESPRGKHKKSNSVSLGNSKRWNVRDLLKRSYSDDNYTTGNVSPGLLFSPPISPKPKAKTGNKVPAYKGKIGNIRVPAYYPYRQDQIGMFGNNSNGSSKNLYRY